MNKINFIELRQIILITYCTELKFVFQFIKLSHLTISKYVHGCMLGRFLPVSPLRIFQFGYSVRNIQWRCETGERSYFLGLVSEEVLHEVDPRSIDEGMNTDGEESNEEGSVPGKRVNAETLQNTQI